MVEILHKGLIGSRLCEKTLEIILSEVNDKKITRIVMRAINEFKVVCKKCRRLAETDKEFAEFVLRMARDKILADVKKYENQWQPHQIFTFWNCSLVAEYRDSLKEIKHYPMV